MLYFTVPKYTDLLFTTNNTRRHINFKTESQIAIIDPVIDLKNIFQTIPQKAPHTSRRVSDIPQVDHEPRLKSPQDTIKTQRLTPNFIEMNKKLVKSVTRK